MPENHEQLFLNTMQELQNEWDENNGIHTARKQGCCNEGIRSSQISALVALLIKKGIIR